MISLAIFWLYHSGSFQIFRINVVIDHKNGAISEQLGTLFVLTIWHLKKAFIAYSKYQYYWSFQLELCNVMTQKHTIRYFEHCFEKRHRKNVERMEFSQHFLLSLHLCMEILEKIHIFQCYSHINFISTDVLHLLITIFVSFCWLWFLARAS